MSLVNGSSLCCLVLDWVKRFLADQKNDSVEQLVERTHLLYLALDNSLQDCSDLPSGDVSDTDIVQDYKKLSLKTQAQIKKGRKVMQPAKPRVLIYNRSMEDYLEEQLEPDWNMIGVNKVGGKYIILLIQIKYKIYKQSLF